MHGRLLWGGLKSFLPLPPAKYKGTGGTVSGAYCYSVWLRHLSFIAAHVGRDAVKPATVVELGPGDSIGLGLAALLSVCERYIALDVLEHATVETNLRVFDELVALFRARARLPDERIFPRLHPRLASYDFPAHLIDDAELDVRLCEANVARLRDAVADPRRVGSPIRYECPWGPESVAESSADLVVSQVVLQDMSHSEGRDDLGTSIAAMARWLRRGGVMSHQINFSFPDTDNWNQHWAYGDLTWTIMRGNRPYYVNRVPLSEYVRLFEAAGCRVVGVERLVSDGLSRDQAAERFRGLPEEDFHTGAALLVATKC